MIMLLNISLCIFLFMLFSCSPDFDEISDTDQRYMDFVFDPASCFSDILVIYDGRYILGGSSVLGMDYKLRIKCYCYHKGELIATGQTFSEGIYPAEISIRHLYKDIEYDFVFVGDIVHYSGNDFYETWYHLGTEKYEDLYMVSFEESDRAEYNVMLSGQLRLSASNQKVNVEISPVTCNGYLDFINLDKVDKLEVTTGKYESFYLKGMKGINQSVKNNKFYSPVSGKTVLPVTVTGADKGFPVKIKTISVSGNDSVITTLPYSGLRPFVCIFDCGKMEIDRFDIY